MGVVLALELFDFVQSDASQGVHEIAESVVNVARLVGPFEREYHYPTSVTRSLDRGRPFAQPRELFADCRDQRQRRGYFLLRAPFAAEDTFNIRQRHACEWVSGARL